MAQYIDKDALVAEIERRISEYENFSIDNTAINAKIIALQSFLIYINTLEVKEVDLEKESLTWEDIPTILTISERLKTGWWFVDRTKDIGTQAFWEEVLKRFKAQKGEKV